MQSLHVAQTFATRADAVFDVLADHAGYASLPGVRAAWLRRPGETHRDGVGAERVLKLPLMTIVERITEYEPGQSLAYRIIESPLPIEHIGARLLLEPRADGATRVHWTSRLRARSRIAQTPIEIAIARQMALGYRAALAIWARRLR